MPDRSQTTANVVAKKLEMSRVGVVIKGIDSVDPGMVASLVAQKHGKHIHLAAIDYDVRDEYENVTIARDVETAVDWRSTPEFAGKIVVFVRGDVPKLHSLAELDSVSSREIAEEAIDDAQARLSTNDPQRRFWNALKAESSFFRLGMIEEFVDKIQENPDDTNAIAENLWLLGLLRDSDILRGSVDPAERLRRNRELVLEMNQLSAASRQRMRRVIAGTSEDGRQQLLETYDRVQDFFRRGNPESIRFLELREVESLIQAGRPVPRTTRRVVTPPTTEHDDNTDPEPPSERLRGRQLEKGIGSKMISHDQDSLNELKRLVEQIRAGLDNSQSGTKDIEVPEGLDGRTVSVETPAEDLFALVQRLCKRDAWGGVVKAQQNNLRDAMRKLDSAIVTTYDPEDSTTGTAGMCLFELLRRFDSFIPAAELTFSETLGKLTSARSVLLNNLKLLTGFPLIAIAGDPDIRTQVGKYLGAYADLLRLFRRYEAELHVRDALMVKFAASELMRLDIVYVKANDAWKAVLTPLNPFHLWRFKEIVDMLYSGQPLGDEDVQQLNEALFHLPHLLHVVISSPDATENQSVMLPQADVIGTLPTYENHTNRYLGSDGVEFLEELLSRWSDYAPYSKSNIRVCVVDAPDIAAVLRCIAKFLRVKWDTRVTLDAYFTREQNPWSDMGELDYDGKDSDLAQQLKGERLVVNIQSCADVRAVKDILSMRPVHIAYLFDQSQFRVGYAPRARGLVVSPLVVSYNYEYSEIMKRGTISPSSESQDGLFSDYHYMIERAVQLPAGQQVRLQHDPGAELGPVNTMLSERLTKWLVLADRDLVGYAPVDAVLLGEKRFSQREVGLWSKGDSRTLGQFQNVLAQYNFNPSSEKLDALLRRFGHIVASSMISIPRAQHLERETGVKGLIGTLVAASWYVEKYPGALIASLDSHLSRSWLQQRSGSNERADLIGMRITDSGKVVIEPIEVKTREAGARVIIETDDVGNRRLAGDAVDQVRSMLRVLKPIFGAEDDGSLLTPARREALKYQLYRECFREIHDDGWQKQWYQKLNASFALPQPHIEVECRGVVIEIRMDENQGVSETVDSIDPISLVTIGNPVVQGLVGEATQSVQTNTTGVSERSVGQPVLDTGARVDEVIPEAPTVQENTPGYSQPGRDATQEENVVELAQLFKRACQSYRIQLLECDPARAVQGPNVVRFYVRLARGQSLAPLRGSLEDIGREMSRSGLIVTTLPHSDEVALDVPRANREVVSLAQGLSHLPVISTPDKMPLTIGVTPEGQHLVCDLSDLTHMLVGGTTGAGKTVFLYGILLSLLKTHPNPGSLKLILSTSKLEDFYCFNGLPHLEGSRVIDDADEAVEMLQTHIPQIFSDRQELFLTSGYNNIHDYNRATENSMPPVVVIVDEFADLADQLSGVAQKEFYKNIRRIAQLGRNRGVHLILCTQRPSANLVPTAIRNLLNARVSLRVNDATASRMVLEEVGAEQLQMHGDLLFKKDGPFLERAQAYYISFGQVQALLRQMFPRT